MDPNYLRLQYFGVDTYIFLKSVKLTNGGVTTKLVIDS